jgi:hypothetical protein
MTKKIVLGLAVVAFAVVVMAPAASASCIPGKSAQTFNAQALTYAYWTSPSGTPGTVVGQFWQLGNPAAGSGNSTVCPNMLYFSAAGMNLNLDLGACSAGCVGGTMAVLAQNQTPAGTEFLVATIVETPANTVNFDYSTQGDHAMVQLPRPRVTSSSRAGASVNLNVQVPAISDGLYGPNAANAITGFNILSASGTTDPGRNAAAYTLRSSIAAAGGGAGTGAVTVDCTNTAQDQWVVTQLALDGGQVSSTVSAATRVNCNPALADPKYKIVPKRGTPKQGVGTSN